MNCTRSTSVLDWNGMADAVNAWQECGCMVCASALSEVPERIKVNGTQTTL